MPSDKSDEREQNNVLVGLGAGGAAGATAGALAGAITGGPVGAIAGAALGGMIGSVSGGAIAYGEVEPEFRREYESSATTARGTHRWEDISPAYRYGWESHDRPELKGKSWDQVNTDLEKGWTGRGRWADYEPHIRSAWERRATQHIAPRVASVSPETPIAPESISKDDSLFQGADSLAALAIGGTSGAYLGGVMGLFVGGPVGMAIGGTLGTIAGAAIAESASSDWHEPAFRAHHDSIESEGRHPRWDNAKVAYRYGWDAHEKVETGGKSWPEARPELEKGWEGPGRFADYEQYVKHAWDKRIPSDNPIKLDGA